MALLMPIVIKEVEYRLANGNTKIYDNHGGRQQYYSPSWDECAGFIGALSINWT